MNDGSETSLAVVERPLANTTGVNKTTDADGDTRCSSRRRANVLVVDDDPASLLAVGAILGDLHQRLSFAHSGEEALRLMLNQEFAVVVLDVRMGGISGYETARYMRQRKRTEHTPIIFLTGIGTEEGEIFEGYYAGAVDYLTKPVVPHVLRAKVKAFVELYLASEELQRQAELLRESERREHQRQLAEQTARFEAERLRQEMLVAARIQRQLFPAAPPPCGGFEIFGDSQTAAATGGDYFDFFPVASGALRLAIGDVCGHGIGSALTMAATRAYVRALSLGDACPAEVLRSANRALAHDVADGSFVTLMLGELDPRARTLCYAGAGHPPGYVLSSCGAVKAVVASQSPALGMLDDFAFTQGEQRLAAGDVVFFVTDGILEAADSRQELFGMERALAVVREHLAQPAQQIGRALYNAARQFAGREVLDDDATSIVIRVLPRESGETPPSEGVPGDRREHESHSRTCRSDRRAITR